MRVDTALHFFTQRFDISAGRIIHIDEEIGVFFADLRAAQAQAAAAGVVVVRSTRGASGLVYRNVEIDDDTNKFVASHDLNPQKARILTQLLIAEGITKPDEVQAVFWES